MIALKKEVSPAVLWAVVGVALIAVIFVGYRMLGSPGYSGASSGSEEAQKKFQATGEFYKPPAGGPNNISTEKQPSLGGAMSMPPGMGAPGGAPAGGAPGGPMGGYNFTPPPR